MVTTAWSSALSFGVEEEFLLVHSSATDLLPCGNAVIEAAERLGTRLHKELTTAQVETNTPVCRTLRGLRRELRNLRSVAADAALRSGARLLAAGAAVGAGPPAPLTDSPRYRRMADELGLLVPEHAVCACHVHIGMPDRETAIQVGNHVRPWLPALLALTANSAVHRGQDTGYASWRSILWSRWPCSGPPPYFASADHYDATVAVQLKSGAVLDPGMIYWDIRPSAHVPTLEVRVSDIPSTVDETALLAALVRGLAATAVRALGTGRTAPPVPPEVLRTAYWRSARDGLCGDALDPFTLRRTTVTQHLTALVHHIRAELEELGDLRDVRALLHKVLTNGNGAIRQRRALSRRGAVADVVDAASRATVADLDPTVGFTRKTGAAP